MAESDIKLIVDIDVDASTQQFEDGLREVVKRLNNNPAKIKLDIDQNSISDAMKKINQSLSGNNGSSGKAAGKQMGQQMAQGLQESMGKGLNQAKQAIKNYYDTLLRVRKKNTGITGKKQADGSMLFTTSVKEYQDLCRLMNTYYSEYHKVMMAIKNDTSDAANAIRQYKSIAETKFRANNQDIFNGKNATTNVDTAIAAVKKYYAQLEKMQKSGAGFKMEGDKYVATHDAYRGQVEALNQLYDAYKRVDEAMRTNTMYAQRSNAAYKQHRENMKSIAAYSQVDVKALKDQLAQYKRLREAALETNGKVSFNRNTGMYEDATGGEFTNLVTQLNAAKASVTTIFQNIRFMTAEARTELLTFSKTLNDAFKIKSDASGVKNASKAIDDYITKLRAYNKEKEKHQKSGVLGTGVTKDATTGMWSATDKENAQYVNVAEQLNKTKVAADTAKASVDALNLSLDQTARKNALVAKEQSRHGTAKANIDTWKNSTNAQRSFENLNAIDQEAKAIDLYRKSISSAGQALEKFSKAKNSAKPGSADAYGEVGNAYDRLTENLRKYLSELNQVNAAGGDVSAVHKKYYDMAVKEANIVKNNTNIIKANGDAHKSLSESVKTLAQRFTTWLGVSSGVMYAMSTIRNMIRDSIALDDSMTQLKIVTRSTSDEYAKFGVEAANTAKNIGASITDVVDSTTTFARLGYDLGDSGKLAELTAMLQKVGDIGVEDAQNSLTSMLKAFEDVDASNMESVMDKLVTVGNGFPISVSQIAEGMTNASSALSAAGNSFEESVALLTAANTTINLCRVA